MSAVDTYYRGCTTRTLFTEHQLVPCELHCPYYRRCTARTLFTEHQLVPCELHCSKLHWSSSVAFKVERFCHIAGLFIFRVVTFYAMLCQQCAVLWFSPHLQHFFVAEASVKYQVSFPCWFVRTRPILILVHEREPRSNVPSLPCHHHYSMHAEC